MPLDHAEGLPPLLASLDAILLAQGKRVVKDPNRGFETHTMFLQVALRPSPRSIQSG